MRKLLFAALLITMAGVAKADDNQHWAIRDGANWTATDNVQVDYFFTEGGVQLGAAQLFIGPLLPSDPDRPVVTSQFVNSNRTICLNAEAYRAAVPGTKVAAVPSCYTFPFTTVIDAPLIETP